MYPKFHIHIGSVEEQMPNNHYLMNFDNKKKYCLPCDLYMVWLLSNTKKHFILLTGQVDPVSEVKALKENSCISEDVFC